MDRPLDHRPHSVAMPDLSSPPLKFEAFFGLGDGRSVGDSSERMVHYGESIDY